MRAQARKTPTPRVWTNETKFTLRICARIPLDLADRLKSYTENMSATNTDAIVGALDEYLKNRGY